MDQSKLHHYVPQMLLRRFSQATGENPLLHRLDVHSGRIAVTNVRNEAAITHYNRLESLVLKSSMTIEQTLAAVEGSTKPILDAIVEGRVPSFDEMRMLATFVYLQHQRTPRAREWSRYWSDETARMMAEVQCSNRDAVRDVLQQDNPDVTDDEVDRTRAEWLAQLESGELRLTRGWDGEVAGMFAMADRLPLMLVDQMIWVLLRAPSGSSFVVGDHPVCIVDPEARGRRGAAWFSSEEVEVTFPIDRTACLLLQPHAPRWVEQTIDEKTVMEVNLRSYAAAEWRVYGERQQVLQDVRRMAKQRPDLVAQFVPSPPHIFVGEAIEGDPGPYKTNVYVAPHHATIRRYGQGERRRN